MLLSKPIKICFCGSVDDGKSTLIGRILFETKNILIDQEQNLRNLSRRYGTTGNNIDYALALDGLQSEREQGITIDVAYKYINYNNRRIIFCDSPGHKQYTKNVVTAASQCDSAVVLLDASKGILEQTKRHIAILNFVGIEKVIFAINKMDCVNYKESVFLNLKRKLFFYLKSNHFKSVNIVPLSALKGDNVASSSSKMKWYKGKSLLKTLTNFIVDYRNFNQGSYIAIQHVHRPNSLTRNYMGLMKGKFFKGEKIILIPSMQETYIKNIYIGFRKNISNYSSNIINLETKDNIDLARGDVIIKKKEKKRGGGVDCEGAVQIGNAFNSLICAISDNNLFIGRRYLMRLGNKDTYISISKIKYKLDLISNKQIPSNNLLINDLGEIEFTCNDKIAFTPFNINKFLGSFILIDLENNNTIAVGKINYALRKSDCIFPEKLIINKIEKSFLLKQTPKCIWFTGVSGSGKSTVAKALEKKLFEKGKLTSLLDADNLRLGINKNLGFTKSDRIENVRRIAEIAKLMTDSGLIVIVACISPYKQERDFARSLFKNGEFIEVFVNTPLYICSQRDPKGLYKKIKKDKSIDTTGLTSDYEIPKNPEIVINASKKLNNNLIKKIISFI
jgi:bifunctional enzyme CysN/CysC